MILCCGGGGGGGGVNYTALQCNAIHYVSQYWLKMLMFYVDIYLCWFIYIFVFGGVKVKSCIGIWREKGGGKRPYVSLGIMGERGRGLDHPQKKGHNLLTVPYTCIYPLRKLTLCTGEFIVAKGKNTNIRSLSLPTV